MDFRKLIYITALFVLVAGCNMQQDVELDLPPHEEELVVEYYLEPGQQHQALVTKSIDFFQGNMLEGVDGVEINISTGGNSTTLLNLNRADTLYNKVFNYYHPDVVNFEEGKEYQLSVTTEDGVIVSGQTRFLPKAPIQNIYFSHDADSLAAIYVDVEDDPAEDNYYRLVLRGTSPSAATSYDGLWDDADVQNGKVRMYSAHEFQPGWSVVVNVYHIEKKYYDFLKSVKQARDANYNPFMQPATIQSTLDGATGVFAAISLTSDTVYIKGPGE